MEEKAQQGAKPAKSRQPLSLETVVIESTRLFGDSTRVHIRHQNQLYQLTITRQNKLILTK